MQRFLRDDPVAEAAPSSRRLRARLLHLGCSQPLPGRVSTTRSPEGLGAQVATHLRLREAMAAADPEAVLTVSPYAFMGHGYLVDYVKNAEERARLVDAARSVPGLTSVDVYLPLHEGAARRAANLELEVRVKAAIAAESTAKVPNVSVVALGGEVVLLGVVADEAAVQTAGTAARTVSGVTGVTSYLLVPEPGLEKLLPVPDVLP